MFSPQRHTKTKIKNLTDKTKNLNCPTVFLSLCGMSRAAVGGAGGGRGCSQVRMRGRPSPHPVSRELRVARREATASGGRGEGARGRADAAWPRGDAPQGRSRAARPHLPGCVEDYIYRGKSRDRFDDLAVHNVFPRANGNELQSQGADPHPPSLPLREGRQGRNHLNEEITPLLPTGIGEQYSQTISIL
jgi:hypothetical protein